MHCCANFWWRILLSCRLTRLNLNSVQFSISFKHGVLWRIRGRISSFWTSPGRFRRIVAMSKSGFGDELMRTAPGVALRGRKLRRKYFSPRHLTRWTDHVEPKACFILALYRIITSSAVLLEPQRLRGIFWMNSCPFSHQFELCNRVNNLRHRHISATHRVCPQPGNIQGACIGCFLLVTRYGHCSDLKDRAEKWDKVNSAEYHRTLPDVQRWLVLDFAHRQGRWRFVDLLQVC